MRDLLRRNSFDTRRTEFRRLVIGVAAILSASISWHVLRLPIVSWIAHSSVGCPSRAVIIASVLRREHQTVPANNELTYRQGQPYPTKWLWTHWFPEPGWIVWESVREVEKTGSNSQIYKWMITVADHNLELVGSLGTARNILAAPVNDFDGDGQWEVVLQYDATPWEKAKEQHIKRWAVIRLGHDSNEIVWIGLSDFLLWSQKSTRIKPIWRDEDDDGVMELVFVTVKVKKLPNGELGFDPPTTVAVFEWDRVEGILRPRLLPDDSGIISWTPPADGGIQVEQDAEMKEVLAGLLPVPEGFGFRRASIPADPPQDTPDSP